MAKPSVRLADYPLNECAFGRFDACSYFESREDHLKEPLKGWLGVEIWTLDVENGKLSNDELKIGEVSNGPPPFMQLAETKDLENHLKLPFEPLSESQKSRIAKGEYSIMWYTAKHLRECLKVSAGLEVAGKKGPGHWKRFPYVPDSWRITTFINGYYFPWSCSDLLFPTDESLPHVNAFVTDSCAMTNEHITLAELTSATGILRYRRCEEEEKWENMIHIPITLFYVSGPKVRILQVWDSKRETGKLCVAKSRIIDFTDGSEQNKEDWELLIRWIRGTPAKLEEVVDPDEVAEQEEAMGKEMDVEVRRGRSKNRVLVC